MRGALVKVLVVSLFLGQTCLAAPWDKKKAAVPEEVKPAPKAVPPPAPPQFPMDVVTQISEQLNLLPQGSLFGGSCATLAAAYFAGNLLLPSKIENRDRRKAWIITLVR